MDLRSEMGVERGRVSTNFWSLLALIVKVTWRSLASVLSVDASGWCDDDIVIVVVVVVCGMCACRKAEAA